MPWAILSEEQQVALQRAAKTGRPARLLLAPSQMKGRRVAGAVKLPLTPAQHKLFTAARRAGQPYEVVIGKKQMTGGFLSALLSLGRAVLPAITSILPSLATAAATQAVQSGVKKVIEGDGVVRRRSAEQRLADHAIAVKHDKLNPMEGTLVMARDVDPRVDKLPIPMASGEALGGLVLSLPKQNLPYAGPRFLAKPYEGDGMTIRLPQ